MTKHKNKVRILKATKEKTIKTTKTVIKSQKKREQKKKKQKYLKKKPFRTINQMVYISIISISVNGLNAPIKRCRMAEWI